MRKLAMFNFMTLNGFFKGPENDIGWHRHGAEENAFAADNLKSEAILLFGRMTYQMMAGYWPTPMAMQNDPVVAAGMNRAEKIVFSRTLKNADWSNTRLVKSDVVEETRKLKQTPGKDLVILGSGSIVAQCAGAGLIDEYQIMIDPVLLGDGGTLFRGLTHKVDLNLVSTRTFSSGVVLLCYRPS